jgi:hypothetical protein
MTGSFPVARRGSSQKLFVAFGLVPKAENTLWSALAVSPGQFPAP